jgi:CBS-domain-containing membrane protein
MRARDIMTTSIVSIRPDASVQDAARLLSEHAISGAPVLDAERRLVGLVTEADIIGKEGDDVAAIMSAHVITACEDTSVDEIARMLTSNRYKRLPIMRDGCVVGIVSRADIVRMIASRWVCPTCGAIQQGHAPDRCADCGADGTTMERDLEPRLEISARG